MYTACIATASCLIKASSMDVNQPAYAILRRILRTQAATAVDAFGNSWAQL